MTVEQTKGRRCKQCECYTQPKSGRSDELLEFDVKVKYLEHWSEVTSRNIVDLILLVTGRLPHSHATYCVCQPHSRPLKGLV